MDTYRLTTKQVNELLTETTASQIKLAGIFSGLDFDMIPRLTKSTESMIKEYGILGIYQNEVHRVRSGKIQDIESYYSFDDVVEICHMLGYIPWPKEIMVTELFQDGAAHVAHYGNIKITITPIQHVANGVKYRVSYRYLEYLGRKQATYVGGSIPTCQEIMLAYSHAV